MDTAATERERALEQRVKELERERVTENHAAGAGSGAGRSAETQEEVYTGQ